MTNNLRKIKQDLCTFAKRCKDVHYSESLLITFLMSGMLFARNNLFAAPSDPIEAQKSEITSSIQGIRQEFKKARSENNKLLRATNLELTQLMEQGDHATKSPWSSWQFGGNYFYNNWNGTYKGRGDKKEKYPYEGVLKRDANEFNRYLPVTSENYNMLAASSDPMSASSNARNGIKNYGIASNRLVTEPPVEITVNAGINPKSINKTPLSITPKVANSPTLPEPVKFEPLSPDVNLPDDPALPVPPTFKVYLGADCNNGGIGAAGCSSSSTTPRQDTKPGFLTSGLANRSNQNVPTTLHYTWPGSPSGAGSLAFKMWQDERADFTGTSDKIYFNSYNYSYGGGENEYRDPVVTSVGTNKNNQYYFVGGSRFIEIDNISSGNIDIPATKTINLGGIFTLALVSQENGTHLRNLGKITDLEEKDENWVINMPQDSIIHGPTEDYKIHRSRKGYVGYKVGIAQVEENGESSYDAEKQKMTNDLSGKINFYGTRSIGMYIYLPSSTTWAIMRNEGEINLYGKESYGMKIAAKSNSRAEMVNANTINLGNNNDNNNPNDFDEDQADTSVGMALMKDRSVTGGGTLDRGKARNEGKINLTNVKNSIGAYVNIDSDITNSNEININSTIVKAKSGDQPVNIGMRVDNLNGPNGTVGTLTNGRVINTSTGKITIDGSYAIGMLAKGENANAFNRGTITSTNIKNGVGIVGMDKATVENSGDIKVVGTGDASNIGIFLKNQSTGKLNTTITVAGSTTPDPSVTQKLTVSGNKSTGVLVTENSSLTMAGDVTVTGNNISGIVANDGSEITSKGTAKVTVTGDSNGLAGQIGNKGSYGIVVKGSSSKYTGTNTNVIVKVTTDKSTGLYSEGTLTINKADVTATDKAINFFASGGTININGGGTSETGQKSLLFYTSGGGKVTLGAPMTSTIKGGTGPNNRGTAFYYVSPGATYGAFNKDTIKTYFDSNFGNGTSTLNHLTLNMESGSRLFVASNVEMNLSDTNASNLMSQVATGKPTITGATNYKTFMLYLSKLKINQAVDLNDPNSVYAQLEIANSSIENSNQMTGSQNRQVAMAQENGNDTGGNGYEPSKVTLTNTATGLIDLTGEETTGIYAKRGEIRNEGTINVGKKSTAIYLIEDDRGPTAGSKAANEATGKIKLGENSTGIFYKVDSKGSHTATAGGALNAGKIESAANNIIAMSIDNPHSTGRVFKNEASGLIDLQGQESTGIFATGTGTYTASNEGEIKLASSSDVNKPNMAMYTDKPTVTLDNNGKLTGGDKTVGVYGYNINLGGTSDATIGAGGTIAYSQGGNVVANGKLSIGENGTTGSNDAVGVYYVGQGGTITSNATDIKMGNSTYGFVIQNENGAGVTLTTNTLNAKLKNDSVYAYSNNRAGTVTNNTVLDSEGNENYGIYSAGTVTNNKNINFGTGIGNVGMYSILGGTGTNNATITVGASDSANEKFGIGMAAGYKTSDSANIVNGPSGVINVNGKDSIGMYATGASSIATNKGKINLLAENSTGMFLDNGATGINEGEITTIGSPKGAKGVVLSNNSKLINRAGAKINIDSAEGFGIFRVNSEETNITVANYGDITVNGGATVNGVFDPTGGKPLEKTAGGVTLKVPKGTMDINMTLNGNPVPYVEYVTDPVGHRGDALISTLGMYVDTKRATNPINGMDKLKVKKAELLFGTEAADESNAKYFEVSGNLLKPYQEAMKKTSVKWVPNSASLTWMALPSVDANGVPVKVGMAKMPYTEFAGRKSTPVNSTDTYNFLDGLEQRYDKNEIVSKEKQLFNKLNHIGNNEETLFYQATDEMMGHQYGNLQQRINATGNILDKEFRYLKNDWRNPSKQSNKIKTFGMRDEYNTDTAGIIDYTSNAYGVAYVHENEKIKMGNSSGWYAGAVTNRFKFKDIGKSKENQTILKAGIFKTMSPKADHNGALQWTIGGDVFVGINEMKRRYLVVDEIFQSKSNSNSYGAAFKTDLGYDVRLSERAHLRPYGALKMEYGRFNSIKEDRGEMRLEVKGNDYFSVKPEVGVEFKYVQPLAVRTNLSVGLTAAYENELGQVGDVKNKGRVRYTNADWFGIRGEKEDRRGNGKFDLNIGVDNTRFGVTVNAGYDTKGNNVRGGIGFRAIY